MRDDENDEKEEPGLLDKALSYVRGRASADSFQKLKPKPKAFLDDEKKRLFEKSFKSVK